MKAATYQRRNHNNDTTISIHAAREGGDEKVGYFLTIRDISIHAAREGGDCKDSPKGSRFHISIHAAREGGDRTPHKGAAALPHFNPRRP